MPMPVSADVVLELVGVPRHGPEVADLRVLGRERALLGVAGRLEERDPHVVVVLEQHLHLHADVHVGGVAVDDVGGEADAVVLLDGDDRDHVGRREARHPRVLVDGEAGDHRLARHLRRRPLGRVAVRAHRDRRVAQLAAVGAALEPEHAVFARLPEELVALTDLRQHAPARLGHDHSSVSTDWRTYLRAGEVHYFLASPVRHGGARTTDEGELRCRHS